MTSLLVLDLGTTYFKFAMFDRDGQMCACHRIAPPTEQPHSGYLELAADRFLDAIADGIAHVSAEAGVDSAEIKAITFATQTNSFLLLDADDRPLSTIILWPDGRARDLDREIIARCDVADFTATTGIPQLTYQFMAAKLLWLSQRCPNVWEKAAKVCLISDFLTLTMTGRHVSEAGTAGLTGLMDIHRCRWWGTMLDRFGVSDKRFPEIVKAGTDLGPIRPQTAAKFGLTSTCRFVVGCLDQYAGAIGVGAVSPGMISETTGTVLATVLCADKNSGYSGPQVFQGPAFREDLCWRMVFGEISANYLQWYRSQLPGRPEFELLSSSAMAVAPGADGLKLRRDATLTTPDEVFEGIRPQHTPGHFVRCIMETVADALDGQVAILCEGFTPARPTEIRSAGGGARSLVWLQIKADVLGMPVTATDCAEPTCLGAAILATATLRETTVLQIAQQWVRLKPSCEPDDQRHKLYTLQRSN